MTDAYKSPKKPVAISDEDRAAFGDLAAEIARRMRTIKSVQRQFGGRPSAKIGIIIQNPDDPDTVQICTEVVTPSGDGFEIACWCTPPGVCSEGPCGGGVLI